MTKREIEIGLAADEYSAITDQVSLLCGGYSFMEGAKWADEHPKISWISVDDDLPCYHEELLETPNDITKYVLVLIGKDKPAIAYMSTYGNNNWHWVNINHVTHWMVIPEL